MTRTKFILELSGELSGLPKDDIEKSVEFYTEMINDRMDEGMSEEEAVEAIGSIDVIVEQILGDISISKLVKEKVKPSRKLRAWEIVLLVLGSPIWISLGVVAIFSLYVCLWAVEISIYAVNITFFAGGISGVALTAVYFIHGNVGTALFVLGAGLLCIGLGLLMLWISKVSTKLVVKLGRKILIGIKKMFVRKGKK